VFGLVDIQLLDNNNHHLTAFVTGTTRVGQYQKKHSAFCLSIGLCCIQAVSPPPVFWIFMEQGKIMEAEVPTVRVGATPSD